MPFEFQTIPQLDSFEPFQYRTSPVFRSPPSPAVFLPTKLQKSPSIENIACSCFSNTNIFVVFQKNGLEFLETVSYWSNFSRRWFWSSQQIDSRGWRLGQTFSERGIFCRLPKQKELLGRTKSDFRGTLLCIDTLGPIQKSNYTQSLDRGVFRKFSLYSWYQNCYIKLQKPAY